MNDPSYNLKKLLDQFIRKMGMYGQLFNSVSLFTNLLLQISFSCLVFYAAFNNLSVIPLQFLFKLPVPLVDLSVWLPSLALRSAELAFRLTHWLLYWQDKWTSSTGKLPRKRLDITETLLKALKHTKQQVNQSSDVWSEL